MRDYTYLDLYLNMLLGDDYGQEPDAGHTRMMQEVLDGWIANLSGCENVLDVGCGATAMASNAFGELGISYTGIALKKDAVKAQKLGKNVYEMDMNFLEFDDESFRLVFARHVLEHSPMPLLSLMEWYRVSSQWLCVVLPNPEFYGWSGLQHYSVMHPNQIEFLLDRAGWHIIWSDFTEKSELRYMCEKKRSSHYENFIERKIQEPCLA